MKKILPILILLPMLSFGAEYVTACKASNNIEAEGAAMVVSDWTNSILWVTAKSPVLNAGTTNAKWVCYAKNCAGNLSQTVEFSQPRTDVTNGVKAWYFDGVDNRLDSTTPLNPGTNDFLLEATLMVTNDITGFRQLVGNWNGSAAPGSLSIHQRGERVYYIVTDQTNGTIWATSTSPAFPLFSTAYGQFNRYGIRRTGSTLEALYNGARVGSAYTLPAGTTFTNARPMEVGAHVATYAGPVWISEVKYIKGTAP